MGYDPACESVDSLTDSPRAGMWFHKQFVELAVNANPSLADEPKFEFPDFDELDKEMEDCWAEDFGYKCCDPSNNKVRVTDDDGEWGVENGEWCGINYNPDAKKSTSGCWAEELGYKCCSKPNMKVIEKDDDGEWSVEHNEWCGIVKTESTCWSEALGYPCCDECVKTVVTNKEGKWGVVKNEWCGIPADC